jgi:hypothetical protein
MRIGTPRRINLVGRSFGRLKVESFAHVGSSGQAYWQCKCSCGSETIVRGSDLRGAKTVSCGCYASEAVATRRRGNPTRTTHGQSKTKTYGIWAAMIRRCENIGAPEYKYYGGRGIEVCAQWKSFENFLLDMGFCPTGFSIERKDVNGNYCPENCIWIPRNQQSKNRRPFNPKPSKSSKEILV